MPLTIRPLHPLFAAEVTGLDLREPPGEETRRAVEDAMDRYAVCALPGQAIDDEQQLRFARLFGELEVRPLQRGRNQHPGDDERIRHHEIFDVSNLDEEGNVLASDDERRIYSLGEPAVAHRQLVPPGVGHIFDAVGPRRAARGRRHRVRRHARRL